MGGGVGIGGAEGRKGLKMVGIIGAGATCIVGTETAEVEVEAGGAGDALPESLQLPWAGFQTSMLRTGQRAGDGRHWPPCT